MLNILSTEYLHIGLIFGLFVFPKILERWKIPSEISCLIIGYFFAREFTELRSDSAINLLSTLGISSLFLFAGLEVNLKELKSDSKNLLGASILYIASIVLFTFLLNKYGEFTPRIAILISLALLTPSTGFILTSLEQLAHLNHLSSKIKRIAISLELIALLTMFGTLQSESISQLLISCALLGALIFLLPLGFKFFMKVIVPYAPKTEFAFLIMMAVISASATKKLGAYYLIGAFIVGIIATRFIKKMPSTTIEEMLHATKSFSFFFVPFYFFSAGIGTSDFYFKRDEIILGFLIATLVASFRILSMALLLSRFSLKLLAESLESAISTLPTLVFGLVITQILGSKYSLEPTWYGALMIATILLTIMPILLRHFSFIARLKTTNNPSPEEPS